MVLRTRRAHVVVLLLASLLVAMGGPRVVTGAQVTAQSGAGPSGATLLDSFVSGISPTPVGFTPAQIRQHYGFDAMGNDSAGNPIDGRGQIIGIVLWGAQANLGAELQAYDTQFSLPAMNGLTPATACTVSRTIHSVPCFQLVTPGGITPHLVPGALLEAAADAELAHSLAPQADIVFVQGQVTKAGKGWQPSPVQLLQAIDAAVAAGATVVSMSFSSPSLSVADNAHFNVATAGFVSGLGDFGCPDVTPYPASSSYVLSVGGTSLTPDLSSETAWTETGGYVNKTEARPGFQLHWQGSAFRAANDVSFNAVDFPVYRVTLSGRAGWFEFNGVSAGIPQWAALIADADQARVAAGKGILAGQGLLDGIYAAANLHEPKPGLIDPAFFGDVATGAGGPTAGCQARTGWDEGTGLGVPHANGLVTALTDI